MFAQFALHERLLKAVAEMNFVEPTPVQVAAINDRVFLVNASLGVYPELLQDREAWKARFGRSRWVAFIAGCATLLRAQRRLRLHIETASAVRDVQTLTLFVGNNRLQLQQLGAEPEDTVAGTPGDGSLAAASRLQQQIAEQQGENERLLERNRILEAEVMELKRGMETVEERARQELGMLKEGETLYLLTE